MWANRFTSGERGCMQVYMFDAGSYYRLFNLRASKIRPIEFRERNRNSIVLEKLFRMKLLYLIERKISGVCIGWLWKHISGQVNAFNQSSNYSEIRQASHLNFVIWSHSIPCKANMNSHSVAVWFNIIPSLIDRKMRFDFTIPSDCFSVHRRRNAQSFSWLYQVTGPCFIIWIAWLLNHRKLNMKL